MRPLLRARFPPPAILVFLYGTMVVLGTLLLKLPFATVAPITWLDAAFTATSAVTITGLSVLGMTFAIRVLTMFGMPIGLQQRATLSEDLNQSEFGGLLDLVKLIIRFVLVAEAIGALLLAWRFVPQFGWEQGLWAAIFHSVSAFNNAGFSLFPDSLVAFAGDPVINLVVPALFILGGLGFTVVFDLARTRRWRGLSLHSKLMLAGWFQALTTRTAGFNSVPIEDLRDSTSMLFIVLMLIGGGSTSTAGGIKVTTFVVLMIATFAFATGRRHIHAFGRHLGEAELMKVLALAVASVTVVSVSMFLLVLTQEGHILDLGFEAASALGTVGLSRDTTMDLDWIGRLLIMFLMFTGRVGPLAFGFVLARRAAPLLRYPPGKVYLG